MYKVVEGNVLGLMQYHFKVLLRNWKESKLIWPFNASLYSPFNFSLVKYNSLELNAGFLKNLIPSKEFYCVFKMVYIFFSLKHFLSFKISLRSYV